MGLPEPRYRRVAPRRAARVQQTLARLGVLAQDAARVGTERWTDGMTQVLVESRAELEQLGLNTVRQAVVDAHDLLPQVRDGGTLAVSAVPGQNPARRAPPIAAQSILAAAAAKRAARSLYAQVAPGRTLVEAVRETPEMLRVRFSRSLLQLALLAPAARAYPAGPAPRALIEPLLRAALAPDERPILKGRVLLPLLERDGRTLAFDTRLGLTAVSGSLPAETCALVRRLICDHRVNPRGVTPASVRGLTAGVALDAVADRTVLAAAERSLAEVLRSVSRELADPFAGAPAPRLVGPLKLVPSEISPGRDQLVDGAGDGCLVPGPLVSPEGGSRLTQLWYLLAEPRAHRGILELVPLLAWCQAPRERARRVAVDRPTAPVPGEAPALLDACAEALADLTRSGVARGLASRGIVREHARELSAGGYGALGARLEALLDGAPERASLALHGAVHLLDRLRGGPRNLIAPDREVSK